MTSKPKLAVLANPQGGNNRTDGAAVAALAHAAGLPYREATEPEAMRSALRELAAGSPDVLVVSGGDGTISAVATALRRETLFESEPILVLLRGGSTNLIQSNIGLRSRPVEALKRLLQVCEHGLPPQLLRKHKPMRVLVTETNDVHYGFFWGAGALPRIMRTVQSRYEHGARRGLIAEARAFLAALMCGLFGCPKTNAWLAPGPIVCVNGDAAQPDPVPHANRVFVLVTSLNRLVLGLMTHLRNGGLRCLALNHPYRSRTLAAYGLSWGRVFPWMRGDWDCEERDAFAIQVWEDWVLDGEIFPVDSRGSSLHIRLDAPFRFLAI
jgi:hypothetical protein